MAPRKTNKQQRAEVRAEALIKQKLRVKTEMIVEDQELIREEQSKLRARFGEIERECSQLKEETKMIVKQTACTHIKLFIIFNIFKAKEAGCPTQAAALTRLLREIVAKEKAIASLGAFKK